MSDTSSDDEESGSRAPAGHEILDLMMPMFSGVKDEFGKNLVPPLPLSVDRVFEGRRPASNARLIQLPFEILAQIIQAVPMSSISRFALVNSDCRQLARSRQFASLHFDYSDRSLEIIEHLTKESGERLSQGGFTKKSALGPCIRRITVATHPGWVTRRHNVELSETFNALPKEVRSERMVAACNAYFGSYVASIQLLLADRTVLPHLELLDWEDNVSLQQSFFDAIVNSTIQHLKIYRASIDKLFTISPPQTQPSRIWPLRSFHLELTPALTTAFNLNVSRLCTSLLHLCAPTLESLTWDDCLGRSVRTNGNGLTPRFPSLRHLRISQLNFKDDALLRELVHDELISLDCDTCLNPVLSSFLKNRGHIPALKTLIWAVREGSHDITSSLVLLKANPQISKLMTSWSVQSELLDYQVLPLLTRSFSTLTSLSLVWKDPKITLHALEMISQIKTLEQLHLSAGCQVGWRFDWLINHEITLNHLSALPLLKKLAFSRDSYDNGLGGDCDRYYETGVLRLANLMRGDWTREMFEKGHRERIVAIAAEYVEKMPRLEWLYFGQIPMDVRWCTETKRRIPQALVTERDDCWTMLREMFGWKGILPS